MQKLHVSLATLS